MISRFFMVLAFVFLLFPALVRAEIDPNYRMLLLTENFPPYNMAKNDKNFAREDNIHGIAADVVREMFKRCGIEYEMILRFPWARIYRSALENPGHGVFVTARLPEREALFKWVGPIGHDDWVLLGKGDSPLVLNNLADAQQYLVGAYKDDAIASHLIEQGLEPITSLRDQANVQKLISGQIDLWATGDPAGRYLALQEGVDGLKTILRFNRVGLYLALNLEVPDEVVNKLQTELDQMRQEGFVDKISNHYL